MSGMTRIDWRKKIAAQREERAAEKLDRLQRVGNYAGMAPAVKKALISGQVETVEQFVARGGRIKQLPGIQSAPPPRTIPTWRNVA
ncbi:hypothetical protein [Xanthomonas albilineans]|uniref:hypothetical protein n=1 Tax=Xanthomonas albilineans TaxID=29447 RepID=UPI0005F31A8C|nr:hypothetical protein [Xanthomonas albilineans]